jgi:hypothetical protein
MKLEKEDWEQEHFGCSIKAYRGEEHNTYVITHLQSNRRLYTCQMASAFSIAKLLDLGYRVCDWYGMEK